MAEVGEKMSREMCSSRKWRPKGRTGQNYGKAGSEGGQRVWGCMPAKGRKGACLRKREKYLERVDARGTAHSH